MAKGAEGAKGKERGDTPGLSPRKTPLKLGREHDAASSQLARVRGTVEKVLRKKPPERDEAIALLKGGKINKWNSLRKQSPNWRPDLRGANLILADLTGANLTEADLTKANLIGANLTHVDLAEADLTGADLFKANLTEANLFRADLFEANLTEADLTGANLTEADLSGANLTGADLFKANLTEANLTEADLSNVRGLTPEQLARACFSEATVDPDISGAALGILKNSLKSPSVK